MKVRSQVCFGIAEKHRFSSKDNTDQLKLMGKQLRRTWEMAKQLKCWITFHYCTGHWSLVTRKDFGLQTIENYMFSNFRMREYRQRLAQIRFQYFHPSYAFTLHMAQAREKHMTERRKRLFQTRESRGAHTSWRCFVSSCFRRRVRGFRVLMAGMHTGSLVLFTLKVLTHGPDQSWLGLILKLFVFGYALCILESVCTVSGCLGPSPSTKGTLKGGFKGGLKAGLQGETFFHPLKIVGFRI